MGKVKYFEGIDYVQGAVTKPKVKDGHTCGSYVIGTHREAPTTSKICTRIYFRGAEAYKRSTPLSQDEMLARSRFTAVSRSVNARAKDLTKIAQDKAAFEAQLNTAGGCKTMKSWLWKVEGEAYDAQH